MVSGSWVLLHSRLALHDLGSWSFARRCKKNRMRGWLDEASDQESACLSGLYGAGVRIAERGGYGGAGWIECRWRLTELRRLRVALRSEKRTQSRYPIRNTSPTAKPPNFTGLRRRRSLTTTHRVSDCLMPASHDTVGVSHVKCGTYQCGDI